MASRVYTVAAGRSKKNGREESEGGKLASYDWIEIDRPEDYGQLLERLDADYEPERIVEKLKAKITSRVKAVLVEYDYVDKDYRSTLYHFYAKKARPYRADCVRLHFFDEQVVFEGRQSDEDSERALGNHYYGYMVLRPTLRTTLGRSVLSPDIRVGAHGSAIQARHYVHLLGHRLSVWGFPSMDQHVDIAACAHVACWTVLRHYSEGHSQYREYLVYDIAKLATGFEPGGISPSRGLDVWEAERVFNAAGCFPVIVARDESTDEEFFGQLLAYLESGFPLFIGLDVEDEGHAIVAAGHSWRKGALVPPAGSSHAWAQVETLLTVDDNLLPYVTVPVDPAASDGAEPDYTTDDFNAFIVALPEKVGYPAEAMAKHTGVVQSTLVRAMGCETASVRLHRYFMTTISGLRRYARNNESQLGETLVELLMRLDTAQFVWVLEFSSVEQWAGGRVAAHGIVDASASHKDPYPIWLLHNEDVAFVFDRSTAEPVVQEVGLNRPTGVPLRRMEVNLRPVRK